MGQEWATEEQGDPGGGRFQGEGEPCLLGGLETFILVSKQAGEKAASYIIAENSYLLLRNKLGVVGGGYAGLWFCNLQS